MSNYDPGAKILWSLAASGLGTTISGSGNSGGWQGTGPGDILPAVGFETPIRLRDVQDVTLMVSVAGITGTPAFTVVLNTFDDLGNLYTTPLTSGSIATAKTVAVSAGMHGGSASSYLVLPDWGQVAWTQAGGGASVTGVQIALFGR